MADKKISALVSLAGVDLSDSDLFPVVDVSAGEAKTISLSSLKAVFLAAANNIGTAGTGGFGVGICPAALARAAARAATGGPERQRHALRRRP